jgi:hypothetical protein
VVRASVAYTSSQYAWRTAAAVHAISCRSSTLATSFSISACSIAARVASKPNPRSSGCVKVAAIPDVKYGL